MSFVTLERNGAVGVITMNRPEALNALNGEVLADLSAVLDEVANDDSILVAIVTGAGRSFVAGADIGQMSTMTPAEAKKFGLFGNQVFMKLETLEKPTIAAVNGFALGGGCELSMSCDIRIASEKAKFGQPEVGLGITPGFGGTQRLSKLVGKGMAKYLVLSAETINAEEALRIGLVERVVEPEALMETAEKLAQTIASKAPIAVAMAKTCINKGDHVDLHTGCSLEAEAFGGCFGTEDQKEGMRAFLEKRPAEFKNR